VKSPGAKAFAAGLVLCSGVRKPDAHDAVWCVHIERVFNLQETMRRPGVETDIAGCRRRFLPNTVPALYGLARRRAPASPPRKTPIRVSKLSSRSVRRA